MIKTITIGILVFANFFNSIAQNKDLTRYDFILVPMTYSFTGEPNQYQLNSLTKHLFKQEGFRTFMIEETLPIEFQQDGCKGLRVDVEKDYMIVKTSMAIKLLDCFGKVVYQSPRVDVREKDFKKAYQEGIRRAFRYIEEISFEMKVKDGGSTKGIQTSAPLSADEKIAKRIQVIKDQSDKYVWENESLLVFRNVDNFELYTTEAKTKIGDLMKVSGSTYLYNTSEINGIATFLENGDLEIKFMDPENKQEMVRVFTKK